jgi:hypothetical protein
MTDTSREALIKELRMIGPLSHGHFADVGNRAAGMLEADLRPKQVTCQIYGHVVGACVECNTHIESQVPEGWDEAVKSAQFVYDSGGLTMKEYTQELAQAIIDMDAKIREVTP